MLKDGKREGEVGFNEIDLVGVYNCFFAPYRKLYLQSVFISAFLFFICSFSITPLYKADVKLQINSNGFSANQFSGVAFVAGSLIPVSSDALYNMDYLRSREVAEAFIREENLKEFFFNNKLSDEGILVQKADPSLDEVYEVFLNVFQIEINRKDLTAQVTVKWHNRLQAKLWANDYILFVNEELKRRFVNESRLRIRYLEDQLNSNNSLEVCQSISLHILENMKKIAVAKSTHQYAFKVIQRAFLPENKIFPKRGAFILLGGCFGFFIIFMMALFFHLKTKFI